MRQRPGGGGERSGTDRRKSQRHEDGFSVRVRPESVQTYEVCELRNVSTGGVAIRSPRQFTAEVGATLLLEFPLGRSASRVETRVTVRGQSGKEVPTLHLEFNDRSPIFVATVRACIQSWESRLQPDRRASDL